MNNPSAQTTYCETEQVFLRHFQKDDLDDLFRYSSQENIGESAGWKHHETLHEAKKMLSLFLKNKDIYAIVSKETHQVIGHFNIQPDSEQNLPDVKELGFVLHPAFHGKHIMSALIPVVLNHLFASGINIVWACCFQHNTASKHLIEKCGFRFAQKGTYTSYSLNKTFSSYEYVYTKEMWAQHNKEAT